MLLTLLLVVGGIDVVKGQENKIRATYTGPYPNNTGGTPGAGGTPGLFGEAGPLGTHDVLNPEDLNDTDYTINYAKITAASGGLGTNLGGAGKLSTAYLNLDFSISPNERNPVFIKATASSSSRSNAYEQVSIQAYSGSTKVGPAVSMNSLPKNSDGYYIFHPTASSTSIRIIVTTDDGISVLGLLGGRSTASVDIYDVYTLDITCAPPTYTTTKVTGITLGGAVLDPDNAIDSDLSTKSTLSVGLLSLLGATIQQTIYFSKLSPPGEAATITFSVPKATLNLDLFNGIKLQAYSGNTPVGTPVQVGSLLSLDLLGLLGNNTRYTASYIPSTTQGFDRIEISTNSVAALLTSFYLHEVQQTPAKPTFSTPILQNPTICLGDPVTISPTAPTPGNEFRWYSSLIETTPLSNPDPYTFTPSPNITETTTYYVATAKTGCPAESERIPVKVTVNSISPGSISLDQIICSGNSPSIITSITAGIASGDLDYHWQHSSDNITYTDISNETDPNLTINIPITSITYYRRIASSTLNGKVCSSNSNSVKITVTPKPPAPILSIQ